MKLKLSVSRRLTHPKSKKSPTMVPPIASVAPTEASTTKLESDVPEIKPKEIEIIDEIKEPVKSLDAEPNQSALFGYSKSENSANFVSVNIFVLLVSWFLLG